MTDQVTPTPLERFDLHCLLGVAERACGLRPRVFWNPGVREYDMKVAVRRARAVLDKYGLTDPTIVCPAPPPELRELTPGQASFAEWAQKELVGTFDFIQRERERIARYMPPLAPESESPDIGLTSPEG